MAIWILNTEDWETLSDQQHVGFALAYCSEDLMEIQTLDVLEAFLKTRYPELSQVAIQNDATSLWAFMWWVTPQDLVLLRDGEDANRFHVAQMTSDCTAVTRENGLVYQRNVRWIARDADVTVIHPSVSAIFLSARDFFQVRRKADLTHLQALNDNDWQALPSQLGYSGRDLGKKGRKTPKPLEHQGDPSHSEDWALIAERAVLERDPIKSRSLLYVVAAVFVLLVFWASWAEVDTVTRGQGKVIPSRQVQVLGTQDGGMITDILVREGDFVSQGQMLVRLDPTRSQASLGENVAQVSGLQVKAARLTAMVEATEFVPTDDMLAQSPEIVRQEIQLYSTLVDELQVQRGISENQLSQRREEMNELVARESQLSTEYQLTDRELQGTRPMLESGAVSEVEVLRLERELNRARGELEQTRAQINRMDAAILEAEAKIRAVELEFANAAREQLTETVARINALQEAATGLSDKVRQMNLVSPVAGTVNQLFFNTIGGIVLPGRDVIELIPADDTLLVEVRIRPEDIGFLAPGQEANVKVTAYDFVVYGGLSGRVEQIGADTLLDDQGNAFYEVTVRTDSANLGEERPIIPGMTVEVDILTSKKTVLEYLLKPVLRAQQRALSER